MGWSLDHDCDMCGLTIHEREKIICETCWDNAVSYAEELEAKLEENDIDYSNILKPREM